MGAKLKTSVAVLLFVITVSTVARTSSSGSDSDETTNSRQQRCLVACQTQSPQSQVDECLVRCVATPGGQETNSGSLRDGALKRRRNRRRHVHQRGQSVPGNVTQPARASSDRGRTFTTAVDALKGTTSTPPEVRLTATVRPTRDGALEVLVAWDWVISGDATLTSKKASESEMSEFTIHWARKTCNVDVRLPHCDDPDAYNSRPAWSHGPKANYTLRDVSYNSKYWVEVEYNGVTSSRLTFQTPGCTMPVDRTFRRCFYPPSESRVAATPTLPTRAAFTQPPFTSDLDGAALTINVSCVAYDLQLGIVSALVTWQLPASTTAKTGRTMWNSTILVQYHTPEGPHVNAHRTTSHHVQLSLAVDYVYEITVKARNVSAEVIYKTRYANMSRDAVGACDIVPSARPSAVRSQLWANGHLSVKPIVLVVGGLILVVIVVAMLIGVSRCRAARQSNLEDKTARSLTKSNSYKSSPSGSPCMRKDEQIQMTLHAKDEWEIDAHDVVLGAELGQGAFGLVMTGYYQNEQVAIKVLKVDALPSHRDELLREINLMKQIGYHANIVALVGACTDCDPIALIMEYMPFGNLQTFLQRCRMEGSMIRGVEVGSSAVQYCPLDQLTGAGDSTWTLSSADMLSFARQIALAMEYLTERKYVHRDLAARNVLVGAEKVVKLCDFGLARLVDAGDQYCKLTNGRLPLKWMALESIRDRVFTAQSDVWSFGVLLWEIATLGASPYASIALVDLYRLLSNGYRLEQPKTCSDELYDVMSQCWYENPAHRPPFGLIRHQLDVLLGHHRNYLDLDNLDMSPAAVGYGGSGTMSPLPTTVQLVYDDDEEDRDNEDSYIDSSPLVGDGETPSIRTSISSSTRDLPLDDACRV